MYSTGWFKVNSKFQWIGTIRLVCFLIMKNSSAFPPVAPIDHVYGTLGLVKATTSQQYSDISKLREEIEGKGSFTMFAPSNDAWEALDPVSNLEVYNFSTEIQMNTIITHTLAAL